MITSLTPGVPPQLASSFGDRSRLRVFGPALGMTSLLTMFGASACDHASPPLPGQSEPKTAAAVSGRDAAGMAASTRATAGVTAALPAASAAGSRALAAGGAPALMAGRPGSSSTGIDPSMAGSNAPPSQIPAQCKGFEVSGLKTSPGGSVLPNTCAPFDPAQNNPYAIRCIDADPTYKTNYAGDEDCILPPPEDRGTQIHVGPPSYADPGAFELAAGKELTEYYNVNSSNTVARYYYRTNWRMRPGGHHMLISLPAQDLADGWSKVGDMGTEFGGSAKSFGGSQRAVVDRPQATLEIPPENVGLGQQLPAHQQFSFNVHSINTMAKPELREVWVNVWYMDDKDVTKPMQTVAATGNPADMSIAAHRTATLEYKCAVSGDTRVLTMYGHYHAHDEHFGAWLVRSSGDRVPVYDSFDWQDIPVYQFDSVSTNPVADVSKKLDGATSGQLMLHTGDELHFQCQINNTSDQALRFANEAITGEMCILFASYTGTDPCPSAQRAN